MPEYPTDAYCAHCNESPESGSHMLGPGAHGYVPPTIDDICACGKPRGAVVHMPGVKPAGDATSTWSALHAHAWTPPLSLQAAQSAALARDWERYGAPQTSGPNLMRVMLEERPGMPQFGVLVGMWLDERGDMQSVVRLDHYGIMLKVVHPSKVTPVTPEQEAAYKP